MEINGNLLLLEWKDHPHINTGQRILFERLTRLCPATVLIVEGDAEYMTVNTIRTAWQGVIAPPEVDDLDGLRERIQAWSQLGDEPLGLFAFRQVFGQHPRFGKESSPMNTEAPLTRFATGAVRGADAENVRFDLITPIGLRRLAETCAEGAKKYGDTIGRRACRRA